MRNTFLSYFEENSKTKEIVLQIVLIDGTDLGVIRFIDLVNIIGSYHKNSYYNNRSGIIGYRHYFNLGKDLKEGLTIYYSSDEGGLKDRTFLRDKSYNYLIFKTNYLNTKFERSR